MRGCRSSNAVVSRPSRPGTVGSALAGTVLAAYPPGEASQCLESTTGTRRSRRDRIRCPAIRDASRYEAEGEARRAAELALAHVRHLQGLLPICSYCKKIRNDRNYWEQIETDISDRSDPAFSHSICPECHERIVVPQLAEWRSAQRLKA